MSNEEKTNAVRVGQIAGRAVVGFRIGIEYSNKIFTNSHRGTDQQPESDYPFGKVWAILEQGGEKIVSETKLQTTADFVEWMDAVQAMFPHANIDFDLTDLDRDKDDARAIEVTLDEMKDKNDGYD